MEWLEKILNEVENKEELIKSIKKAIGENFVSKADFNEKNESLKTLNSQFEEVNKKLKEFESSTETVDGLKAQIIQLQKDNQSAVEKYENEAKDFKLNSAIKLAIAGKVHDESLVSGLFNKEKLVLGDDGKVIGLDEQFKELKENKSFLFKDENAENSNANSFKFGKEQVEHNINDKAISSAFGLD